jgi:hypothetical protein
MSFVSASSPQVVHPPSTMLSRDGSMTLSSDDRATSNREMRCASGTTSNGSSSDVPDSGQAITLRIVWPHADRPARPDDSRAR